MNAFDWVGTLFFMVSLGLVIAALGWLQSRNNLKPWWETSILPALVVISIHIGLSWAWHDLWMYMFHTSGFFVFQTLLAFGLYTRSLDPKALKSLGSLLTLIAVVALGVNGYGAWRELRSHVSLGVVTLQPAKVGRTAVMANADYGQFYETPGVFDIYPMGPITILDSFGEETDADKGSDIMLPTRPTKIEWVKFKSRADTPVEVILIRR